LYIEPEVHSALKALSEQTRVPVAVYLREAVADLLTKYDVTLKGKKRAKSWLP
jgi:predicted DNA-binding protein